MICKMICEYQCGYFGIFVNRKNITPDLLSQCITKPKGYIMTQQESLLTTQEVADFMGIASFTLAKYRMKGIGPKYIQLGKKLIRYRKEDIEEWLSIHIGQSQKNG